MSEASHKLVLESVKNLFTSGDYSDLTITCDADVYNVHKNIVCSRSKFFAKAVNFGGKETELNRVDLPEDDPATIKLLIQYLYEGDYLPKVSPSAAKKSKAPKDPSVWKQHTPHTCTDLDGGYCDESNVCDHHHCGSACNYDCVEFSCRTCLLILDDQPGQLSTHAHMYSLGDQYGVVGLKQLSKEKFKLACRQFWDTPDFAPAAHLAFSTTMDEDKGLRELVSETIAAHMKLVNKPEIEVLMTQFNGLAFGILKEKVAKGWK